MNYEVPHGEANWTDNNIGRTTACIISLTEILPVNLGIFTATEVAFNNPSITAAAFAVATLVTKTAGSVAAADLLDTTFTFSNWRPTRSIQNKIIKLSTRFGSKENIDTSFFADLGVSITAGTVATVSLKKLLNPEISREKNRRRGIETALATSALFGVGGWMVAENINHPNQYEIGAGALSTSILVGVYRYISRKRQKI